MPSTVCLTLLKLHHLHDENQAPFFMFFVALFPLPQWGYRLPDRDYESLLLALRFKYNNRVSADCPHFGGF